MRGLAVGSFGPIDIDKKNLWLYHNDSKTKLGKCGLAWCPLRRALNVQCTFTTDVNSSAYGEVVARNNAGARIENSGLLTQSVQVSVQGVIQRGEFIGGVWVT